jgi:Na+-translocating ferredoxin:NAD+ oxidoreductase RnfA subunit
MGSNKPQEHGMNACEIFLSLMASKSVKPILHSLLKPLQMICLYAKFMLVISYLGLLTNLHVKSLVRDVYDGGVEVFPRISSEATPRGHLHRPN